MRTFIKREGKVKTAPISINSQIFIIDDDTAIFGSGNINDRSLLGNRDSEVGCMV